MYSSTRNLAQNDAPASLRQLQPQRRRLHLHHHLKEEVTPNSISRLHRLTDSIRRTTYRGPPKGYIEVLEGKLRRLEVLLGKIVESKDPRTQPLLQEILGDETTQELLAIEIKTVVPKPPKTGRKTASPALVSTGFVLPQQSPSTFPPPLPTVPWSTSIQNPFAAPPPSNPHPESNISGSFPPSNFHSDLPPLLPPAQNHPSSTQSVYQPPYDTTGQSASLPRESQFGPSSSRWQKRRLSTSNVSQYFGPTGIDERSSQYASASNQPTMDPQAEWATGREVKRAAELEDVLGQLSLNENECVDLVES